MLTCAFVDSKLRIAPVACGLLMVLFTVSSGCTKYRVAQSDGGEDGGATGGAGTGGSAGTGAADFNPGAKTDVQGNLPGIFITRFAY